MRDEISGMTDIWHSPWMTLNAGHYTRELRGCSSRACNQYRRQMDVRIHSHHVNVNGFRLMCERSPFQTFQSHSIHSSKFNITHILICFLRATHALNKVQNYNFVVFIGPMLLPWKCIVSFRQMPKNFAWHILCDTFEREKKTHRKQCYELRLPFDCLAY